MARLSGAGSLLVGGEHFGEVVAFDGATGLGTITLGPEAARSARGPVVLGFHCTQIADGSRTISAGTRVRFRVIPANLGQFEASGIEPYFADAPVRVGDRR